jgi:hypothetical protein
MQHYFGYRPQHLLLRISSTYVISLQRQTKCDGCRKNCRYPYGFVYVNIQFLENGRKNKIYSQPKDVIHLFSQFRSQLGLTFIYCSTRAVKSLHSGWTPPTITTLLFHPIIFRSCTRKTLVMVGSERLCAELIFSLPFGKKRRILWPTAVMDAYITCIYCSLQL